MHRTWLSIARGLSLAVVLWLGRVAVASADDASAGSPGEWLARFTSARTLGLGSAYVATANDPLGVLWNPAGLSWMDQNELRFETARLFEDTSINSFGFAVPGSWLPSFGLTMVSLGSGDFQKTNELNDDLGTFREGETAYLFTVAKGFSPSLSLGANVKVAQQTVESFSAGGFGFDLGALWSPTPGLRLGGSVMNLMGPKLTLRDVEETYPMQFRGGAALQVFSGRGLITAQLDQSDGLGLQLHGGAEYWIQPAVALRGGFDDQYATGGFSYRFLPQYQLDYAVADHPLGMTHRVGLAYKFGGFFASSKAEPEMFSPTGEHAVTRISLNARTKGNPDSWTLDILDKSDAVVRRFGGAGQPPSHLEWDGKDESGMPLADGTYRYHLVVKDKEGRQLTSSTHAVVISTAGPQGAVPVVPVQ
jgi:hypothetical protein